jgi:hypothetical protein
MATEPRTRAPHTKGETPEAAMAFDVYVKLGSKRSHAKVAEETQIGVGAIQKWSKQYDWHGKVLAIQAEAVAAAKEETKEDFFKNIKNLTEYKYELLGILKKKVSAERFCGSCEQSPASISEVIRVLEVVKTELGEPTTIAKGTFTEDKGNPFADIFSSFFGKKDEPARAV